MKFTELKKFLQTNTLNNYLLLGNDAFLIDKSYELISQSKNFEPKDLNVQEFTESVDANDVVKALDTMPMMSEYKLVYVNVAGENDKIANLEVLTSYLKSFNKTSILVISAGENKQAVDKLMPHCEVVDCNKLSPQFVNSIVVADLKKHNKTITPQALQLLGQYTLYDLQKISSEVQKLASFAGSEQEVTEDMVKQVVNKNLDFHIFDLTENLAKKNAARVLEILQEIRVKKENERTLIPLINNHFRRLFQVSLSNGNFAETASFLKVKEYAVKIASQQSKMFKQTDLKAIAELCLQVDYEMKSGSMNFDSAINYLVLTILNM